MSRLGCRAIGPGWRVAGAALATLAFVVALPPLESSAQTPTPAERLEVTPELSDSLGKAPQRGNATLRIKPSLRRELELLTREKRSWTPIQRKIKPRLLLEYKRRSGMPSLVTRMPGAKVDIDTGGMTLVDIKGRVTPDVLQHIESLGGVIINSHPRFKAIRARIPIEQIEEIAASPDIENIRPASRMITRKINTSQGDVAHRAATARTQFGVDGSGKKVCAISDSVDALASLQASGDLPAVDVLAGQSGNPATSEGTALLEIVYDLAPGAALGYATAVGGQAQFAANILALAAAGCHVIVDDVFYPDEPVFQDGPIAAAIDQVTAQGVLYFSSAGNEGNLNDGTSGVWEGNFVPVDISTPPDPPLIVHDFGGGIIADTITGQPPFAISLQWSDPQGGSSNDYDLYMLDSTGSTIIASSTSFQTGTQDPFEIIGVTGTDVGNILIIVRFSGSNRMVHLNTIRGRLAINTVGQISGHPGARGAIAVAAVNVATAGGGAFTGGASNPVETFSSDGPRRVFFEANGTAITPGNFSSTGGELRQKPEIAAADGVATATPGPFFNPFFGTSAAGPHAAAIAALMLSAPSKPSPDAVRQTMFATALDIEASGVDRDSGHGIVDAFAALDLPDLIAEWVKLKPGCPGAPTACQVKGRLAVVNQGFGDAAGASTARIYYSTDATLDPAGDIQLAQFPVSALAAGAIQVNPVKLSLPGVTSDTSGGTVYVRLDVTGVLLEIDELNNQEDNGPF